MNKDIWLHICIDKKQVFNPATHLLFSPIISNLRHAIYIIIIWHNLDAAFLFLSRLRLFCHLLSSACQALGPHTQFTSTEYIILDLIVTLWHYPDKSISKEVYHMDMYDTLSICHITYPSRHEILTLCWLNVGLMLVICWRRYTCDTNCSKFRVVNLKYSLTKWIPKLPRAFLRSCAVRVHTLMYAVCIRVVPQAPFSYKLRYIVGFWSLRYIVTYTRIPVQAHTIQTSRDLLSTMLQQKIGHSPNAVLILDQRRRRWANIKPPLVERLVFAGTLKRRYPTDNCCLT